MTDQNPRRPPGAPNKARLTSRPLVLGVAVLCVVAVGGLGLWANRLSAPVTRAGSPTAPVTPLPAKTTAAPTSSSPSASGSATASSGGSASGSAIPSASSSEKSANWPKVAATGKFKTASNTVPTSGSAGKLRRFAVQVETSTKLNANRVGEQIAATLNDPRSWAGSGNVRFALTDDPARASLTIIIAAPATAKGLCKTAPSTCLSAGDVVIDASRWLGLPAGYTAKDQWQSYLVNHGVGSLLGESPQKCSKAGRPAPVMAPQEGDLDGCLANPWPFA